MEGDRPALDVLEDGDCLAEEGNTVLQIASLGILHPSHSEKCVLASIPVRHPLQRHPIHRQDLIAWTKWG